MEGPPIPNPFIGSPFEIGVPAMFGSPVIGLPRLLEFELKPFAGIVGSAPMLGFDERLDGLDCCC